MISEREKLEFESLPEFIREPYSTSRESYVPPAGPRYGRADDKFLSFDDKYGPVGGKFATIDDKLPGADHQIDELIRPKNEALDTLWPGVDRDFFQPSRRAPSFYLTIGFLAGAMVSLAAAWGYTFISHAVTASATADGGKKIVVAGGQAAATRAAGGATDGTAHTTVVNGAEVIAPAFDTYEVRSGDTLAGIAFKAYHRASPRLLDEICRANNMRSANVLNLGQKLTLPEYHPQISNIATGAASPSM